MSEKITQEYLKSILDYDPETGVFRWKERGKMRGPNRVGQFAGSLTVRGYVKIKIDRKLYLAHRLAWLYMTNKWPVTIDQIDNETSNNKFSNLRDASHEENQCNRGKMKNNKCGYKGVYKLNNVNRWRSRIKRGNQYIDCGTHKTPEEAYNAYCQKAKELHDEYARLA